MVEVEELYWRILDTINPLNSTLIMAYLTTRPIDELYSLSVNFFPHRLLSTIPAKSASSGEMRWAHLRIMQWAASHR
jgi:hypothetical protein